jgi:short-subunit dehydrogenase
MLHFYPLKGPLTPARYVSLATRPAGQPYGMSSSPRKIFITGASSGIGRATAVRAAERGDSVALFARREDELARTAEEVVQHGGEALVVAGDVTDRSRLAEAVGEASRYFGGIDVGVANAGVAAYGRAVATRAEDFDVTIETTLTGAVNTIHALLPELERSAAGGDPSSLVVTGSAAGLVPLPLLSAYTAAKQGLRAYVDVLSAELAEAGSPVSVSLVSPGPVNTPFWDNVIVQEGRGPGSLPGTYQPEDVAAAILLAADRRSAGLTVGGLTLAGQALHSLLTPLTERLLAEFAVRVQGQGEARDRSLASEARGTRGHQPLARRSGLMAVRTLVARVAGAGG